MTFILLLLQLFNSTSIDESAIRFTDCTYAFETDISSNYYSIYSNKDSLFIMRRTAQEDDKGSYNSLIQLLPEKKVYRIKFDYIRHTKSTFKNFIIKNNYLYTVDLLNLYIFEKNGDKYIQKDSIYFNKFLEYMDLEDDNIILYSCVDSPEFNKKDSAGNIFIVNKNKISDFREINYPTPKGIVYTFVRPRKLIDYKNKKIAISDAIDYRILFYDLDGNLTDSLKRDMDCFISNESYGAAKSKSRYDIVESVSNRCMISKINFINDNTFLVTYQTPPSGNKLFDVYHDIWLYKDNKWQLANQDIRLANSDSTTQFHPKHVGVRSHYIVNDNIISVLTLEIPFPLNEDFYNMNMREFKDSTDLYFPEKSWGMSVLRYKLEVNNEK